MSRYKGGRHNARSQEPPLPTLHGNGAVERSSGKGSGHDHGHPTEAIPLKHTAPQNIDLSRLRDTRPTNRAVPQISRPGHIPRIEERTGHTPAADFSEIAIGDHVTSPMMERDNSKPNDALESHNKIGVNGTDESRRRKNRGHTVDERCGHAPMPSRLTQDRGADVERATRRSRAVKSAPPGGKDGTFSPRMTVQPTRPQAFKGHSSREELKRMISGPIPTVPQDMAASPPKKPIETRATSSHSQTAPELSLAPRFDAPISAVNAGQRIVRVKYGGSDIFLPITPSTTPVDIIRAAARQLSAAIDERSTILLESFKQVGLERPLRRYEHIRDVLNSWDNDAQNALVIIASPSGGKDDDLDARNVSKGQPDGTTVHLYYSQKPGSWDKRWITLRSDGQITVAKKRGGETTNICHLSDFDIYIPTPRYVAKKIRPPKKVCFAIKSQQKSSMFMTTENFVHFFCTSDRSLGTSWYTAVQEWRSWYLVNVMGEGHRNANEGRPGYRTQAPLGSGPPVLKHLSQPFAGDDSKSSNVMRPVAVPLHTRGRTVKPNASAQSRRLAEDLHIKTPSMYEYQTPAANPPSAEPFDPASLLGRAYTQKQKALQRPQASTNVIPPIAVVAHKSDSPQRIESTNGLNRHSSQRHKTKPLVDLTPVYQEPPQHSKKGRGVIPSEVPAGGLIEVATSPENPVDVPSATTWRKAQQ